MSSKIKTLLNKARGGNFEAGLKAAQIDSANGEQLEELSYNSLAETRIAVASHPNTSAETTARLAYDPDIRVAAAVARRENLSPELLHSLTLRAVADHAVLRGRERAHVLELVVGLADNPEVGIDVIEKLQKDIPTSHLPRLLAAETTRLEVMQQLLMHPKMTVRMELLSNPELPEEILRELCLDDNQKLSTAAQKLYDQIYQGDENTFYNIYVQMRKEESALKAPSYNADKIIMVGGKEMLQKHFDFFLKYLPEKATVYDLGCATGVITSIIAENNKEGKVIGIDISEEMLSYAKTSCSNISNVEFICKDISRGLEIGKDIADYIICSSVLFYMPDSKMIIDDCFNALKKGGQFAGIIMCVEDDSEENMLLCQMLEEFGIYIKTYSEATMELATSGLIIEEMGEYIHCPSLSSPDIIEQISMAYLGNILDNLKAAECDIEKISFGGFFAAGKKPKSF
jgi:ubiquinone/menaquinone biosynthesis C-methylase UbiE